MGTSVSDSSGGGNFIDTVLGAFSGGGSGGNVAPSIQMARPPSYPTVVGNAQQLSTSGIVNPMAGIRAPKTVGQILAGL
jgi:hypothetical protein